LKKTATMCDDRLGLNDDFRLVSTIRYLINTQPPVYDM
jgi:hypothetical protein